jgi:hypothetical protein
MCVGRWRLPAGGSLEARRNRLVKVRKGDGLRTSDLRFGWSLRRDILRAKVSRAHELSTIVPISIIF